MSKKKERETQENWKICKNKIINNIKQPEEITHTKDVQKVSNIARLLFLIREDDIIFKTVNWCLKINSDHKAVSTI